MATPQMVSFTDPYATEQAQIERNRRMAQALQQQANQELPTGNMAGGYFVATNPLQYLAQAIKGYGAQKGLQRAEEAEKALQERATTARTGEMSAIVKALQGTPERPAALDPQEIEQSADQGTPLMTTMPARPGDPNAAAALALGSQFGDIRSMAPGLMNIAETRQNRAEDRAFRTDQAAAQRQARIDELTLRLQDSRLAAQDRANLQRELANMQIEARREMAAMTAANRPERMLTVMGPNGEPITMPQSQAAGMPIYNPTAAKQLQEGKAKDTARNQMNSALTELAGYYQDLRKGGGIVSQDNGKLGNVGAWISSTDVGQTLGNALGTTNQQARQKIEQARPLLLNLIKNATGMSAQQMNSNAEMQLYLRAATDPKLSYEANIEALKNLDKLFGLGIGEIGLPPDAVIAPGAAPKQPTKGTNPLRRSTDRPQQIVSDADYEALPSGALFIDPNGVTRRKP